MQDRGERNPPPPESADRHGAAGSAEPAEPPAGPARESLRSVGMRSAFALSGREALGMVVRLGGVVVLTRLIGPEQYGIYAGSVAVVFVVTLFAQMSTERYLVRQTEELDDRRCHEVFTFLLVAVLVVTATSLGVATLVGWAFGVPVGVFQLLVLSLPASVLWAPAQALLERSFRFGKLGALELGGDVVLYAVALPLAALGMGASGAAIGFVVWQLYLLVGSYILAPYRPALRWSSATNRQLIRFGAGITSAQLLRRAGELVNPLVVGPIGGAAMVGVVALGLRLVEALSVVMRIGARLTFAGLARVQHDRPRFASMLSEAMALQTLAMGVLLGTFSLAIVDVLPFLFGVEWTSVLDVLPWLAFAALLRTLRAVISEALAILGRVTVVGVAELIQLIVLVIAAIPLVAAFDEVGFGIAVLVALVPTIQLDVVLRRMVRIAYAPSLLWIAGFGPLTFAPVVAAPWRYLLVLPAIAALATPPGRAQLRTLLDSARSGTRRTSSSDPPAAPRPERTP